MWTRRCPYRAILLPLVLALAAADSNIDPEKHIHGVIKSENEPPKINYIRQSIDNTTGHYLLTVEMESDDLPQAKCVFIQFEVPEKNFTQTNKTCDGWDKTTVTLPIEHAVLPATPEAIKLTILINPTSPITGAVIEFTTSAFETSIAIVGSNTGDSNAFLRVNVGKKEDDVSVGDETCSKGDTCYFLYSGQKIKERKKIIDVNDKEWKINVIDDSTMPIINLDELSEIKLVNEEKLDIAINNIALTNSIAVFTFDDNKIPKELECSPDIIKDSTSCNFNMTGIEKLNIVAMTLDPNSKVLESTLEVLDNLKIQVEMFTLSSLKVTWKGNSDEHYLLDIETEQIINKKLSTVCTIQSENCLAFFTDVNDETEYTLSVKKEGSKTKVAQTINTTTVVPDLPNTVMPLRVIESNECTKFEIELTESSQVNHIEVSVTRSNGAEMRKQTILEAQKVGNGSIYSSNFATNPEEDNAFDDVTELILLGYDDNDKIIATSYLSYQYTDIKVSLTYVGKAPASEGWSLRVVPLNEDQDLQITDAICTDGGACYVIEPKNLTICVDGVGDTDTQFKQCDETQEASEFQENDKITEVKLLQDTQEVIITSNKSSDVISSEIYLYYADGLDSEMDVNSCDDPTSCSISIDIPKEEYLLKILIVSLDKEDVVLKSALISFEDLKLDITELTSDILQTNWHHGDSTDNYLVHFSTNPKSIIRDDTDDLYSTCHTNDTCTALFSHVEPNDYIFTVHKAVEELKKVTSKSFTVTGSGGDDPESIDVLNIIESSGCTKMTLEKSNLLDDLPELGVSITSHDDSGILTQTFEPGTKLSEDDSSVVYSIPFVFDSSKRKQDSDKTNMVLVGRDGDDVIATAVLDFQYKKLSSKINPVGGALNDDHHSIRVVRAEGETLQNNASIICLNEKPCYFIEPNRTIPVCRDEEKDDSVQFCNDASSKFEGISDDVSVEISDDGLVQISTKVSDNNHVLEVVVYEDKKTHNILSKDENYNCARKKIDDKTDNTYSCSQETKVTKDLKTVWVLVVEISSTDKSVVKSIRKNIHIGVNQDTEVWVIVVSSIGALFGVIFIIFAILVTWKKLSTKKEEKNLPSQNDDTKMEKNTNVHNEGEEQYGDDLHMSQLRSKDHCTHATAYDNPAFAHCPSCGNNMQSKIIQNSYAEPHMPGNVARNNYAARNNAYIPNNGIQNVYGQPDTSGNGTRGMPRTFGVPRTNHQNPHARPRNPPIHNNQVRRSNTTIPSQNPYTRPYTSPPPPMRAKDPAYDRLSKDNATSHALERAPVGPIPRIPVHPSRAQQYRAIRETTAIPPHGNWDVDI